MSKAKIFLRKASLNRLFITRYQDLIQAVASNNYEAIENLCEENLTVELAARVYDYQKNHKVQFRVINGIEDQRDQKPQFDVKVINHFYLSNMSITREENPSLRGYVMRQIRKNWIQLERTEDQVDQISLVDARVLDDLFELKNFYQKEDIEAKQQKRVHHFQDSQDQKQEAKQNKNQQVNLKEMKERAKLEKSSFVKREAMKAFKEIMVREHRLIEIHKPKLLDDKSKEYLDQVKSMEQQEIVEIDQSLLKKDKKKYLEQLSDEFQKQKLIKVEPFKLTVEEYTQKELEKSDLFLFTKVLCPSLYEDYVRVKDDDIPDDGVSQNEQRIQELGLNTFQQMASIDITQPQSSSQKAKQRNFLMQWLTNLMVKGRKQTDSSSQNQLIEVYDVLITSKLRLQMFHLPTGTDYLGNKNLSNYMDTMQDKFHKPQDEDSVYAFTLDKQVYDVNDNEFQQTHCIRFEFDKSKKKKSTTVEKENKPRIKITDIDFYLEGNRHCKAKASEFVKEIDE